MKHIFYLVLAILIVGCAPRVFKEKWTKQTAPDVFRAKFETTQGDFVIVAKREWSPQGVDRLYQLLKNGFYKDVPIFRVVPKFVAQFGIHNDSVVNQSWNRFPLDDEPVILKNDSMNISYARGGKRTRTNQIFINLKNNNRLDTISYSGVTGFPGIAKVTAGMENILKFYGKYGDKLGMRQDSIQKYGNKFIKKNYPEIDFIKTAYILK